MDSVQSVSSSSVPFALIAAEALANVEQPLSLFGNTSSVALPADPSVEVQLSTTGIALSAASTFQDQLAPVKAAAANSSSDLPGFVANAQSLVDAFNGLQSTLSDLPGSDLFSGADALTGDLAASLDAQAQSTFNNGTSELTQLSQIGIDYQTNPATGAGTLRLDLPTLESAFANDSAGATSLLASTATNFSDVAAGVTDQSGSNSLGQGSLQDQSLLDSLLFSSLATGSTGTLGLAQLLALSSPSSATSGTSASLQQSLLALNEFSLVSSLLG